MNNKNNEQSQAFWQMVVVGTLYVLSIVVIAIFGIDTGFQG